MSVTVPPTSEILAWPALLTTTQVAAAFGISPGFVRSQIAAGEFPIEAIRLGRLMRFRRRDLLDVIGVDDPTVTASATPTTMGRTA